MLKKLRIFASWFFGGLVLGLGFLLLFNPMAGLASLIVVVSLALMFVAPAIHLYLSRDGSASYSPIAKAAMVLSGLLVLLTVLVASGIFNFT
jgi:hypothetical protein